MPNPTPTLQWEIGKEYAVLDGIGHEPYRCIVVRLTATQVIVRHLHSEAESRTRFRRDNGQIVGGGIYADRHLRPVSS